MKSLFEKSIDWEHLVLGGHDKSEYKIEIGQAVMHKESGVLDLPVTLNFVIPASDLDNIKYAIKEKLPFVKNVKFDIKYKEPLIRKAEEPKNDVPKQFASNNQGQEQRSRAGYRGHKELKANGNFVMGRTITGEKNCELTEIAPERGNVIVEGEIYKIDSRVIKSGNLLVSVLVTDNKTTICCKGFVSEEKFAEMNEIIHAGDSVKVQGEVQFDTFDNMNVIMFKEIEKTQHSVGREDTYEDGKRVELHLHTKMSQMDGLCDEVELVKQAMKWGHKGIAITDHNGCQAFPHVFDLVRNTNKGKDEKLGAAFVAKECANVKINNCSFIENSNLAQSWYVSGAAIRITCSESNYFSLITNCTFINNSNEIGSGIVEVRMDATISNCSFIDNYVGGAGVLQVGGSNKSSIILDCIFKNNEVLEHGAICTLWDSLISNCTFIDNYAHKYGGAICNHYNTDVVDCIFINNSAGRGGAITTGFENTVSSWLVNINSSYFENNSAIEDGGAILARYVNIEDKVFINNCSFINNSAKDGGAINLVVDSCKCSDSIFINNSAKDRGGAIFILGNNTFINNLNLTSNNASYGGGVYIEGSETEVNNILFIDNHANPIVDTPYNDSRMDDGLGGAAFLNGENIVVMNSILYNNTARNGSGFYLRGINMSLNNVSDLSPNQAWSYLLPINITGSKDFINFNITHIGGNNINRANKGNFIYLNASNDNLIMDGEIPVDGVENSNDGALLFKDTCEQNQTLYWIILDDSNKEYLSGYDVSDLYGSISLDFNTSLFKPNVLYTFKVYHLGEDYYTYIDNFTYFTNPVPIVSKTTKESFEFVGEVFNYTIAINNIAPLDSDFIVTDYLPDNFVYQGNDCMDKCIMLDLENHKITWNISVSANSTYYITLWGYSNKSNIVLNNFVKISNDFGFEVNDTHTIPVYSKANLTIDKTVDVSSEINKGDIVNWTITVFNYGPNSASDVVISDLIDNETMRIIEVNDTRYNKSSGKIYLGDLDKNSSFSFIITTEVIKSNIVIINVANVISSSYNECNETIDLNDSAFIDVLPQANLDVIESVNVSGPVNIGDLLTFSISVVNDGQDSACDVIITDLLDSSVFSFISCNDSRYDNYTGEFKLDEMKSGEVLNFDVVVEVTKSNINVTNDVNVFSPTNSSLGFANNVSDSIIVNVLPQANLRINQSANSTVLDVGDNVTFIINVFNDGPDTASNVLITDILNNSYLKIKGSNNTSYNISSGKLELGDLEANGNVSFEIYAQVIKSNKDVTNLVNAFSPTNNKYHVANNVSNNLTITILPVANIKISKSSNVHKAKVGDSIVWTITVKNNGPDTAKTVFCVDKLPKGLKFINYISCLDDDFDIGYYDPVSGEWVIGDMDCGSIAILTIFTKAIKSGNFTNIVGVHSDTYNPDGDIVYDNASVEITKKEFSKNKSSNVPSLIHDAKTLESKELKYSNNPLSHKSNDVKMINTGNPMLILFISMIACCLLSLRRKI